MTPIFVNAPDDMAKVRVLTTKDRSTQTLKTLHAAGVLHVEKSDELKPVDREAVERDRGEVNDLLTALDSALAYIPKEGHVALAKDVEVIYVRPLAEIDSDVRSLCNKLGNMHQRVAGLEEEAKQLTELTTYLSSLDMQHEIRLTDLSFCGRYLFSRVFVLPDQAYQSVYSQIEGYLFDSIAAPLEDETTLYIIARAEDQTTVESAVKSAGGRVLDIPGEDLTIGDYLQVASDKIRSLEEEMTSLNAEIEEKTRENSQQLILFREALSAEAERLAVLEKASEANYVTVVGGWIPEGNVEETVSQLKEKVGLVYVDTRAPTETEEPPTRLRNAAGIKPFEVIVNLFGTPRYREWDPTPITAYSFAVFFGLMLCDVAYAIGIILAARFLIRKFVDDPYTEGYRLFQRVLYISGGVALVLGLFTGSYLGDIYHLLFGVESAAFFVAPVRDILTDPISFIILSIVLGLVHVNTAHLMGLIGGAKRRDKGIVLNKISLFTLQICGIPIILSWLFNIVLSVPPVLYDFFLYGVGVSVVAVVVSSIMKQRGLGAIFWIFDLTGLLGDVMSYARLAGVGLATLYLASSFNMLAQLFSGMIPGVIGVIIGAIIAVGVLVVGHLINLALSGIGCFVHSLRLCFVEFLSKFYEGGGEEYSPFRLKTRPVLMK